MGDVRDLRKYEIALFLVIMRGTLTERLHTVDLPITFACMKGLLFFVVLNLTSKVCVSDT